MVIIDWATHPSGERRGITQMVMGNRWMGRFRWKNTVI